MHEESEEARQWDGGPSEDGENSPPNPNTEYSALDDQHVWKNAKDGEES